jgi:cytolysin (calcineurin-like family phosphatase)
MGAAYAEGSYPINDSTEIELKLFDCAGQAGAGIYSMQYLGMMNFQSESDDEYTKTTDFNGNRAIEHAKKDNSSASLSYLAADRLLVTLEGRNTGIDMLKKAAGSLNLK